MTLAPTWRARLFAIAGAVLAVVLGAQIAQESYFWAGLCAGAGVALIVTRGQSLQLDTVLLGALLVGYIVGNRGFAQLSLSRAFPLLPAELVLLITGCILIVSSVQQRRLPWRRDSLNIALLVWMLIGTCRVLFDVRAYGFVAVRDYALVYYGGFFFVAQHAARNAAAVRFLHRSLLAGCFLLLLIHPLVSAMPGFFLSTLTARGVPLIFFKDDLVGNFMAIGSLMFFIRFERSKKLLFLALSLALAALMITTNSRSSMVGLAVGAAWLAVGGRWKFTIALTASGAIAIGAIFLAAYMRSQSWQRTPLQSVYERTLSILDPQGQRAYQGEDTVSKGDNNVFRMVWWRAAIDETRENNVWFGLGFGYDLADRFVRQYFPDSSGDFTARSPHNVLITVFARMGVVGSLAFLSLIGIIAARTLQSLRRSAGDSEASTFWCAAWVILICACFGVVLEGPMGAVVFWILLGLANASEIARPDEHAADTAESGKFDADLRSPAAVDEVATRP
jgi:O-antigen ligase